MSQENQSPFPKRDIPTGDLLHLPNEWPWPNADIVARYTQDMQDMLDGAEKIQEAARLQDMRTTRRKRRLLNPRTWFGK